MRFFKLLCDVLGDELSIGVGRAHFHDGKGDGLSDHLFHLGAQALDLRAALADHDTGAGAVDKDTDLGAVALDLDGRHACAVKLFLQKLADLVIFDDQIGDFIAAGVPAGIPILNDAHTHTVRMNFLSHS